MFFNITDAASQLALRQILVDECFRRHIEPDSDAGRVLGQIIARAFRGGITCPPDLARLLRNAGNDPTAIDSPLQDGNRSG